MYTHVVRDYSQGGMAGCFRFAARESRVKGSFHFQIDYRTRQCLHIRSVTYAAELTPPDLSVQTFEKSSQIPS